MSPEPPFRILVICTGNTCRSPIAAACLAHELRSEGDRVQVESAGTGAEDGWPASPEMIALAAKEGIALARHRSRGLTRDRVRSADLILAMEEHHRREAERLGAAPDRVELLSRWPDPRAAAAGVADPIGGSMEAYEECWRRIREHVQRIVPHVREALRARSA